MVSEDSDQVVPGLFSIHRLSDLGDVRETRTGQVSASRDQLQAAGKLLEIPLLRRMQRMSREERDDRVDQLAPTTHRESIQMLLVVVVPPIRDHASHFEEALELPQTPDALRTLCHGKLMRHLKSGFVALATRSRWLPNEANGEAALSVYKTDNPAELDQSFLLISCTRHIVTVPATWDDTRSAGFSGVPAYGQMRTARLPVRGAAFYLRTVPDCYYSSTWPERSAHF
jgi:hypothetical protein